MRRLRRCALFALLCASGFAADTVQQTRTAQQLAAEGRYGEAEQFASSAIELADQAQWWQARAAAQSTLAMIYASMGRYREAERLYIEVLPKIERISGP